uniref:Uncharacterized protein n=2 Tax=Palpitomonas bilix TaxID=652834 RepID=A0A7S3DHC0_9EUKA|mmetsp:Transcript_37892/g.97802  ORF Transcript_37892/g.97802 Transcript_37892/m.97802 type:complete len:513 (+) Transcript_37892:476-2014(+)
MLAARVGSTAAVQTLIDVCNAQVEVRGDEGSTPLHWAAAENDEDTLRVLLHSGGVHVDARGEDRSTALHSASKRGSLKAMEVLIEEYQAEVDALDILGRSPLIYAVLNDEDSAVELLVHMHGANTSIRDELYRTPAHYAAEGGCMNILSLLFHVGEVSVEDKDEDGRTVLHLSAKEGQVDAFLFLLETGGGDIADLDIHGQPPLHLAAINGKNETILAMLERQPYDTLPLDSQGAPLSFAAVKGGHIALLRLLCVSSSGSIRCLRERDENGLTLLHVAAQFDEVESISFILENDLTDVDSADFSGRTALHIASEARHMKAMTELIVQGANTNANSIFGYGPLDASLTANKEKERMGLNATQVLLDAGARLDILDREGNTVVRRAILDDKYDFITLLLDGKRLEVNELGDDGLSLFHFVIAEDKDALLRSMLLRGVGNPLVPTKFGLYPLHVAARAGASYSAQLLVAEFGCEEKTVKGKDVANLAESSGHNQLAIFLRSECGRERRDATKEEL